jgi:hypothetical protein
MNTILYLLNYKFLVLPKYKVEKLSVNGKPNSRT